MNEQQMRFKTNSKRIIDLLTKFKLKGEFIDTSDNELIDEFLMLEGSGINALCDFADSTKGKMILKMIGA